MSRKISTGSEDWFTMQFEYEITKYPAEQFTQLIYFCTDTGECKYHELPPDQTKALENVLNERGALGWEMGQMFINNEGIIIIWKRILESVG
jgi:hypothetical protein